MISINRCFNYGIHFSYYSILVSFLVGNCILSTFCLLNLSSFYFSSLLLFNIILLFIYISFWINDFNIELIIGLFSSIELLCLYFGFKLFIISEFLIFLSLFSSFINYFLISSYSFFIILYAIPFSNLLILLYSSFSLQSSLLFIKIGFLFSTIECLSQTISIGFLFLILQLKEFLFSYFTFTDYFIGSIIYSTTGLHGLHVIIGLFLLLSSFYFFLFSTFN